MVTASSKITFHALPNSGNRSSLTISQTRYLSTSSSSSSLLRTVRARTSLALAGSVCSRWDSLRVVFNAESNLSQSIKKLISSLLLSPGIVPQFQRCLSSAAAATHGAPCGRLPWEQAALCCGDHLWTDQRLQALELLKGTELKLSLSKVARCSTLESHLILYTWKINKHATTIGLTTQTNQYIHLCSFTGWEPLGGVVSTAPYCPV